jgi:hypothetical protein
MAASDYVSDEPEFALALKGASADGKRALAERPIAEVPATCGLRSQTCGEMCPRAGGNEGEANRGLLPAAQECPRFLPLPRVSAGGNI